MKKVFRFLFHPLLLTVVALLILGLLIWWIGPLVRIGEKAPLESELARAIPNVTQRMLTLQLRELEEAGIVARTVYAEVPPRVDYALTDMGRSLEPVLTAMRDWGLGYSQTQGEAQERLQVQSVQARCAA